MSVLEQESNELEIYQQNILKLFNLNSFDESKVVECIDTIYDKLENDNYLNEQVKKKLSNLAQNIHSDDPRFGFLLLYSFDNYNKYQAVIEHAIKKKITPNEFQQRFLECN